MSNTNKAFLLLEDGTLFEGKNFGMAGTTIGEVVFSTSMVGYQEAITDPCYCGQILVQTFPLIGNYGTNKEDMTSDKAHLKGYIVREWCEKPSNYRMEEDIDSFLKKMGVIGIYDIDTRHLTRILRSKGSMKGMITTEEITDTAVKEIKEYSLKNLVKEVTEADARKVCDGDKKVAVINFGNYEYIVNNLKDCEVTVFPSDTDAKELETFDGIVLTEGPGNPYDNEKAIETVKALLGKPMLGIGLGHQILAIANGFKCEKMPHGHRGASQPVVDKSKGKTYITTQNHGYVVTDVDETKAEIRFKNANDSSVEGLVYKNIPAISVQFRPTVDRSRQDTAFLYNEFLNALKGR